MPDDYRTVRIMILYKQSASSGKHLRQFFAGESYGDSEPGYAAAHVEVLGSSFRRR